MIEGYNFISKDKVEISMLTLEKLIIVSFPFIYMNLLKMQYLLNNQKNNLV